MDNILDNGTLIDIALWIVAPHTHLVHFGRSHTENEDVVRADSLVYLDVRAVVGSQSKRAVQHKLHISRTRSLRSGKGYLLGYLRRRHQYLGKRYAVILKEDDLQFLAENGVVLYLLADAPDHLDDLLCDIVTGSCLRRENIRFRNKRSVRVLFQIVVIRNDVHRVELLTLVFVQTLHLNVENAVYIQLYAGGFLNVLRKALLVAALYLSELFEDALVVREYLELYKLGSILFKPVADTLGKQVGKLRVGLEQPSSVRDTVGDILELVRLVKVLKTENVILDDLRVELGNSVYAVRSRHAEICHMNFALLNDGHFSHLIAVARSAHKLFAVTAVDLTDDLVNSRQNSADKVLVPLFKSLGHYRVVGVGEGAGDDMPSLIPAVAALVKEYSHKLGDSERRVSIVYVDSDLLVEIIEVAVNLHMAHYDIRNGSSAHKILLAQTKCLALRVIIVRVKHLGNRVRNVVRAERRHIIARVERSHIKRHTLRAPQTKLGNAFAVVARNEHIIRNGVYAVVTYIFKTVIAVVPRFLDLTVEAYLNSLIGHGH